MTMPIWEALEETSEDGRTPQRVFARFTRPFDADVAVKENGNMGGTMRVEVYGSIEDWREAEMAKDRESGLRKLTPRERKALGV